MAEGFHRDEGGTAGWGAKAEDRGGGVAVEPLRRACVRMWSGTDLTCAGLGMCDTGLQQYEEISFRPDWRIGRCGSGCVECDDQHLGHSGGAAGGWVAAEVVPL